MSAFVVRLLRRIPKQPQTVLVTCCYAVAAAVAAVAFQVLISALYRFGIARFAQHSTRAFLLESFAVVVVTSAIVGWLLNTFCPEAAGSGIPQLKLAFWKEFGFVSWRTVWVKFAAGALSIGGGSSLGREGPSVHLAGGIGSALAGIFGEPKQNRRRAAAAGAAAGLAAAFNTPLAAITFVLEEIIEDLNSRFLGSVLLASVLGAMIVHGLIGPQPAFTLMGVHSPTWIGYLLLPFVAAASSMTGIKFQEGAIWLRGRAKTMHRIPNWSRPVIGGILTWLLGVAVFLTTGHLGVFGLGYDDLSAGLAGKIAWHIAAILVLAKLAATIFCYGFGGCGGIFSPSLFLGGMTGIALSGLLARGLPIPENDQIVLGVVGMSACLGAVVGAPLTGLLIVFEMTHEFSLVPALMLGALVSQGVRRLFSPFNFYEAIIRQDGHRLEEVVPPRDLADWQQLPVSAIANFKPVIIANLEEPHLKSALDQFPYSRFPVVIDQELRGIVTRAEIIAALREQRPVQLHKARTVLPKLPIRAAQNLLLEAEDSIVVVYDDPSRQVIALVTLHDLLRAQLAFAENKR